MGIGLFLKNKLDLFFKSLDIRESSKSTYRRQLKEFYLWLENNSQDTKDKLERESILDYKDYLKDKKRLSSLTIAGYLTALRRLFDWLDVHDLHKDVTKGIKGPKKKLGFKKDSLTLEQAKKLLSSIDRR